MYLYEIRTVDKRDSWIWGICAFWDFNSIIFDFSLQSEDEDEITLSLTVFWKKYNKLL